MKFSCGKRRVCSFRLKNVNCCVGDSRRLCCNSVTKSVRLKLSYPGNIPVLHLADSLFVCLFTRSLRAAETHLGPDRTRPCSSQALKAYINMLALWSDGNAVSHSAELLTPWGHTVSYDDC